MAGLAAMGGLILLYLEPITIAIGLGTLVVHLVGRRAAARTRVATP